MGRTIAFLSFDPISTDHVLTKHRGYSAADALGTIQALSAHKASHLISRHQLLVRAGETGATFAIGPWPPTHISAAAPASSPLSVGIVGMGLAGLTCADTLKTRGIRASLYEAATRTGGRC